MTTAKERTLFVFVVLALFGYLGSVMYVKMKDEAGCKAVCKPYKVTRCFTKSDQIYAVCSDSETEE